MLEFLLTNLKLICQVEKLDLKTKTWVDTGLIFEKTHAIQFTGTAIPHFLPT